MRNETDIIIVGGGISGLIAAREAAKKGRNIILLESRSRLGGRIYTAKSDNFSRPIETGAEFIHGNLPVTIALLKEAKIDFFQMEGKTYNVKDGKLLETDDFDDGFPMVISKLKELEADMPFSVFLAKYLNEKKYEPLNKSLRMYAEGYDASDIRRVSTFALRDEWINESSAESFRLKGGYSRLVEFLAQESRISGCEIRFSTVVKEIRWRTGHVEVLSEDGQSFHAGKVLVTVPLGVLLADTGSRGHVRFSPEIPEIQEALKSLGYGDVIKFFLEFKEAFWENRMPELDFVLSDAPVPTWWTQLPDKTPLLTGWLAGPGVLELQNLNEEELLMKAVESLSYIFGLSGSYIQQQLTAKRALNWNADPFALGAYSYTTVESKAALEFLNKPVKDTIYFAGEAFYEGSAMGTVEAALISGIRVSSLL